MTAPVYVPARIGPAPLWVALALLVAVLFVVSLGAGRAPFGLWQALGDAIRGEPSLGALVLVEIRLPRTILGLMVGATLGLSGAALQGLLRNPLAEPGLIGVSSSAGLGAVLAFYTGLTASVPFALPLGGMAGALIGVVCIYALAGRYAGVATLILAGIAISSIASSLITLVLNLSSNPYAAIEIFFWLLGSLSDRSFDHVTLAVAPMLAGWVMLLASARMLDALSLGEEVAVSLGVDLARLRALVIVGSALSVGAAVAVAGVVGFVGLVVPHLLRPLVGHRPGALLGVSALGGAALILAADSAVRPYGVGPELKLGVVTALIGAPFFLYLVVRMRRSYV